MSNFTKNVNFLTKWQKNHFFGKKKVFGQTTKVNFKLKMLKFAGNHDKTKLSEGYFLFLFIKVSFLKKKIDQKVQKI